MNASLHPCSAPKLQSSILLVEDAPDLRELLKIFLKRAGLNVQAVSSAHEALASMQHAKFDLILSDIGLPDIDGISLIEQIRSMKGNANSNIPAIALTGFSRADHPPGSSLSIFQAMLLKPVERLTLLKTVQSVLDDHSFINKH